MLFRCSIISSTFSYLLLCLVILPKVMFRIQLYLLEEPHYRNVSNPYTYCWRIVPRWQRWLCSTLFNSLMVSLIDLWLQITLLTDFALHLFVTVISLLLLLDNKNTQTKKQMTAAAAGRLRPLLQTSTRLWRWWLVFHLFVPALTNQQTKHCCLAMTFFTFIVFGTLTVHPLGFLLSPCTRWCAHARDRDHSTQSSAWSSVMLLFLCILAWHVLRAARQTRLLAGSLQPDLLRRPQGAHALFLELRSLSTFLLSYKAALWSGCKIRTKSLFKVLFDTTAWRPLFLLLVLLLSLPKTSPSH